MMRPSASRACSSVQIRSSGQSCTRSFGSNWKKNRCSEGVCVLTGTANRASLSWSTISRLIGPPAVGATPGLIELTNDGDETVRWEAAEALGKVGAATEAALEALIELLEDASPPVKASAAGALER